MQPDEYGPDVGVGKRPFRVARAGGLELIQRDHRLHQVAAVGELQIDDEAIGAVGVAARFDKVIPCGATGTAGFDNASSIKPSMAAPTVLIGIPYKGRNLKSSLLYFSLKLGSN